MDGPARAAAVDGSNPVRAVASKEGIFIDVPAS